MKNNLLTNNEEIINLINFLTLVDDIDYTRREKEINLGNKIVTTKLETCHYLNGDTKSLIISNDEGKNIEITLTRKIYSYTRRDSYMDVLCSNYANYLNIDFYEDKNDSFLTIRYTLSKDSEDMESFKPITLDLESIVNKSSLTYTKNRDIIYSYVEKVAYKEEEIKNNKVPSKNTHHKIVIKKLGYIKTHYKNVIKTEETKMPFKYKVSKDLKTITRINNENQTDYELKNKNINVKSEIKEFVSKLPYYSKKELNYILDELLKEYTISPVKKIKKAKTNDYRNVTFE